MLTAIILIVLSGAAGHQKTEAIAEIEFKNAKNLTQILHERFYFGGQDLKQTAQNEYQYLSIDGQKTIVVIQN